MKMVHHHFETISSTNDWGKENLLAFDKEALTIVTATRQSSGRGQYGKKWFSPESMNLYASFCFFVDSSCQNLFSLTHVLGISVATFLENCGIRSQIKLPNDLLVNEKKIAGILCETTPLSSSIGVVLGIGFNVNMKSDAVKQIDQPATSLFLETQKEHSLETVFDSLKLLFSENLQVFLKQGFTPFSDRFQKLLKL